MIAPIEPLDPIARWQKHDLRIRVSSAVPRAIAGGPRAMGRADEQLTGSGCHQPRDSRSGSRASAKD